MTFVADKELENTGGLIPARAPEPGQHEASLLIEQGQSSSARGSLTEGMEGKGGWGGETVQSLVLAWSCIRTLRLKSFGTFHVLSPARQQRRKPDSSWQHFTKPAVLTSGGTWPVAVLMFPYLFRNELFVPCLTGLQLCKGRNPSKGSDQTKGELLNTKAEAER